MSTPSVSAVCPGCNETLRIPASWADKAVKCKKCGAVVRATASAPVQPRPRDTPAPTYPNPLDPTHIAPPPTAPTPTGTPAGYPAPAVGYPGAPAGYPYTPPGYGVPPGYGPPPGYPAAPPGYGPPPGYPAPAPGYGHPTPGYPYAPPPGYGIPPGYPGAPAPAYGPPAAPTGDPVPGGFQDAPADDSRRFRHDDDDDRRPRKRRYKKASGNTKWIVLGLFGVLLAGGGVVAALKWDSIKGTLGMKGKPKEKDAVAVANGEQPGTTPAKAGGPVLTANPTFDRRMLLLSATKYLYCNPLTDGVTMSTPPDLKQEPVAVSELSAIARRIASLLKVPAGRENNQLYVVTDDRGNLDPMYAASRPMLKSVTEQTLTDFCATCRPQDRTVIYFGGHAFAKDGKAYLVPANGDMQEIEGGALIPLTAFWKTLADCPAQQKVVLFDVCRLNEDGDAIRPGSEPMTKELQDLLHTPPAGVEVVTACSEGQTAREFRRAPDRLTPPGSVFLHALRNGLKKSKMVPTPEEADEPIPVPDWVAAAQGTITERFGPKAQTLKYTAGPAAEPVAATDQPPPERVAFVPTPKGADVKEVKAVFDALALAPIKVDEDAREDSNTGESLAEVVFFPADALADYKTDMTMEEAAKAGDKFPVRAAAAKALLFIRDKWAKDKKTGVQTRFTGSATDEVKREVKEKQIPFADLDVDFNELNADLEQAKGMLAQEKSKYWRAMFLYASAQTKARLAFVNEYNLILGRILTESLPDFNKDRGLQLVSVEKMESKKEYKQLAADAKETFDELIAQNKGTPWAVLAKQYRVVSLGLKWQEYKPPVMVEKDKDD